MAHPKAGTGVDSDFRPAGSVARWKTSQAGGLMLDLGSAVAELSLAPDGSARVRAAPGRTLPTNASDALGRAPWPVESAELTEDEDGALVLTSKRGRIEIGRDPFALRIRDHTSSIVAELGGFRFAADGRARAELVSPQDELVHGFGELWGGLDRRGRQIRIRNQDANLDMSRGELYLGIPFFLAHAVEAGRKARGIFLDSFGPSHFDVACQHPERIRLESSTSGLDVYVFPGPAASDVLTRFTERVGRTPLPPRWALGHHQSRWSYKSEREVRALAREIRRQRIPTDAIHLDIDYMEGFRVFTWAAKRFPDPKTLLEELREQGFRVVCVVDPGVKVDPEYGVYQEGRERDFFLRKVDGTPYTLRVWPGESVLPDLNRPAVRAWWGEQHRPLVEAGVAGIWNDMNEPAGWQRELGVGRLRLPYRQQDMTDVVQRDPLDPEKEVPHESVRNLYGQQQCRATHEFLRAANPEQRPFVLTRSGYAGIQRLAAVWTGDSLSRWSHLRASLPMLMNLSLSGVAFCGADIGGFAGNCTPELYARWIQIGALYPFARTHSMWLKRRQEPWRFGARVTSIARAALELRMRLLPYLYALFHEGEASGAPIWRPLWYEFPEDREAAQVEDQVMIGPWLMAAPVLERSTSEREVYLPAGVWLDWQSDARFVGPRRVRVAAPLERMPLFVRGGAVIATQSPTRHARERPLEPLVLEVYPGADGESCLYEDDGETTAYRDPADGGRAALARTRFRLRDRAGGRLRLEIGRREGDFGIEPRPLRIAMHGCPPPEAVFSDGERLPESNQAPGYRCEAGTIQIRLIDRGESRSVETEPAP